jgi:hypothetical protein
MWRTIPLTGLLALFTGGPARAQYPYRDRYPPPPPERAWRDRDRDYDRRDYDRRDYDRREGRQAWRYENGTGGVFERIRGDEWLERRNGYRDPIRFREVRRTPDYVELYDRGRNLYVRIFDDALDQRTEGTDWQEVFQGRWVR